MTGGRPSARTILLDVGDDYITIEVTEAPFLYAVYYKGAPFGLRSNNLATNESTRYFRNVFPTSGGAKGLAKRLNAIFRTTDFTAVVLMGEAVELEK